MASIPSSSTLFSMNQPAFLPRSTLRYVQLPSNLNEDLLEVLLRWVDASHADDPLEAILREKGDPTEVQQLAEKAKVAGSPEEETWKRACACYGEIRTQARRNLLASLGSSDLWLLLSQSGAFREFSVRSSKATFARLKLPLTPKINSIPEGVQLVCGLFPKPEETPNGE